MAEAIKLDIVVDDAQAIRAVEQFRQALIKTGIDAETVTKQVNAFEQEYKQAAAAARKASDDLAKANDGVTASAQRQTTQMASLSSAVMRFAGPAVLLAAAKSTIAWADSIQDLADRTKFSTTAVQQMGKVAEQNGSSFTALASAVQIAEQRLVDGNKKALDAVAGMGLSVDRLLAMKPEDRLRELAKGLADIEDPARRSSVEMAVFGRTGDALAPTLNAIAAGADKAKSALGPEFIGVGSQAQDMLDDMLSTSKELLAVFLMWPTVMTQRIGEWSKGSLLGTWAEMQGWHGAVTAPALPGAPKGAGAWMPSPLAAPGSPFDPGGVGGNSWEFVNRALTPGAPKAGGSNVLPFVTPWTNNQWAQIQTAAMWGANPLGNGGLGAFPGWANPNPLASSMSLSALGLGFDRNSQMVPFAPTVAMNAPGATGGSFLSKLFGGGKLQNLAGAGLGILSSLIPGLSRTGSSIGGTLGSFLGPLGSGIGSLAGGLIGKLFGGGNKDQKELSQLRAADDFKAIVDAAKEAGINVDKLFSTKKVKDFEAALKDVQKQLGQQEADTQRLTSAMEKYGFSIADMGEKFKQTEMNKTALDIAEDFRVLVAAGADVNKVLEKMAPTLSSFVNQSIEMGTTIPNEMEPIIRKAKEMGLLFDKNGDVLSDEAYASIKWTESMTKGFDRVVEAINRLTDAFKGVGDEVDRTTGGVQDLDRAIRNLPDPGRYTSGGPDENPVAVSTGGIIQGRGRVLRFGTGGFVPFGTDTVPAMLTPGEMVTSAGATKQILKALKDRHDGGASLNVVFVPQGATEDDIVESVFRQLPRRVAGNSYQSRTKLKQLLVDRRAG